MQAHGPGQKASGPLSTPVQACYHIETSRPGGHLSMDSGKLISKLTMSIEKA
ncbi:hypothetical protein AHiyo1_35000 [Arthrobacter sp. Hiyo1]|nr:hypothetical protein AHiyo1_35000 [Arthrobacter sp. Hiyo1]